MKKIFLLFSLVIFGLSQNEALAENYRGYQYTDMGYIYSDLTVPASASKEINKKEHKKADYENLKKGVSSSINILKLIEIGNAGIMEAAEDGGIKKIHHVEVRSHKVFVPLLFLPIYFNEKQTIVYGE